MSMNFRTTSSYESRRRWLKKWNTSGKLFFFFLACLFFIIYFYFTILGTGDVLVKPGTYSLEKWATLASVPKAFSLDVAPMQYKLYLRFFAPKVELQAGTYKVEDESTIENLFKQTLLKPLYNDLTITILPGWNIYDIDLYLSEKKIVDSWAFLLAARDHFFDLTKKYPFLADKSSVEGFLYPDTYRILPTSDAYIILDKLLSEWQKKIGEKYTSLGKNAYNELILASIVEREERKKSEQPIVADILSKRVKEGIPMWADATVCYEYAKTQKQCTPEFIGSVIAKNTKYNTRNQLWYPPTPISTVSLSTWESVMNKEPSPYYYYLHGSDGVIHYGRTLSEHNSNKRLYLQ